MNDNENEVRGFAESENEDENSVSDNNESWFKKNRKKLLIGAGSVAVLSVAVLLYKVFRNSSESITDVLKENDETLIEVMGLKEIIPASEMSMPSRECSRDILGDITVGIENLQPYPVDIIYTTGEWNGYGKQNYYSNVYKRESGKICKYKHHRWKFFDGNESKWIEEDTFIKSWDINDPNKPYWLEYYL